MKWGFDQTNIISTTTNTTGNMDRFGKLLESLGFIISTRPWTLASHIP
jgi:hypothetical protein